MNKAKLWCIGLPGQIPSLHSSSDVTLPVHSFPPFSGGGLVHARCRALWPLPQDMEHALQVPHVVHAPSTGHPPSVHNLSCEASPGQLSPPLPGDGLSHDLRREALPDPQVTEHAPHSPQSPQAPSTGQSARSHALTSVTSPIQSWPPFPGGGSSQSRDRDLDPDPQVSEQLLQDDQPPQLPSTVK